MLNWHLIRFDFVMHISSKETLFLSFTCIIALFYIYIYICTLCYCFCLQNSIRHNLSLHSRFMRVQNEGTGKSSWWMINRDAKPGKSARRR